MGTELDPRALWGCSYGIYVVTSSHEGKANGQIANTVFQVTAEPPGVVVAINRDNYTHGLIEASGVFGVSVLAESTPMPFIGRFGFNTGREMDKLEGVETEAGAAGCPLVLENAVSVFDASVFAKVDAGTHTLFVAKVVSGRVLGEERPLTYAKYHEMKGRAPKAAPTYRPPETGAADEGQSAGDGARKKGEENPMQRYVCGVCGYVYDPAEGDPDSGVAAGTAFEDLPEDWVCPVCGADKDEFAAE